MMTLCGLKVILSPEHPVPAMLRFGPNGVVVMSIPEYLDLAQDSAPGAMNKNGKISALLQEHGEYLSSLTPPRAGQ